MNHQVTPEANPIPLDRPLITDDAATPELLASWRVQDQTDDVEKIRAAEQELAEFKKAMHDNRSRSGEPLLYP